MTLYQFQSTKTLSVGHANHTLMSVQLRLIGTRFTFEVTLWYLVLIKNISKCDHRRTNFLKSTIFLVLTQNIIFKTSARILTLRISSWSISQHQSNMLSSTRPESDHPVVIFRFSSLLVCRSDRSTFLKIQKSALKLQTELEGSDCKVYSLLSERKVLLRGICRATLQQEQGITKNCKLFNLISTLLS